MNYLFREIKDGNKTIIEQRFTICVSGAASGHTVDEDYELAVSLGREIAKRGHILTTGATVGLPNAAAEGSNMEGGMSIGFSPAASLREHLRKYRLPYENYSFINFSGLEYAGRDLYLVQSSDAIITIGGRFGSLHEFTSAIEAGKPCGVLIGSGGTADVILQLMDILEAPHKALVVYDSDPKKVVEKVEQLLKKDNEDILKQFSKRDEFWYHKKQKN